MKVTCIENRLTSNQKLKLGIATENDFKYPFEIGETYTVLGITCQMGQTILEMPYFYIFPAPMCLFNIVDDRLSSYWKLRKRSEHGISFWPEEFYQEYFHDDLSDGVPEVVDIYKQVIKKLEEEFA
ncbi:hypothetical protein [Biostraticola tofi]|uniref:Uncharacterized protein n=1 Tax=Biostraticola tofi TaxID=466109 RepID=A0A4R3YFN8_9GAMM|nr:hypothetical protein [Biostraticola tofi]TCV90940.1 hypothetical protein EDC52_1282 [Biostraticola tofi]